MSPFSELMSGQSRTAWRLDQSRELVLSSLASAFGKTLSSLHDMGFERGAREDFAEREYLAFLQQLCRCPVQGIERFRQSVEQTWRALDLGEVTSAEDVFGEVARCALHISPGVKQQTLQVAHALVDAVARECSPLLARLERRLRLSNLHGWSAAHHLIGPAHVFAAIHQTLSICDFSPDTHWRLSIFAMREMRPYLIQAYQSLEYRSGPASVVEVPIEHSAMSMRRRMPDVPAWVAQLAGRLGHNSVVEPGGDAGLQDFLLDNLSRLARQSREVFKARSRAHSRACGIRNHIHVSTPTVSRQQILSAFSALQASSDLLSLKLLSAENHALAQALKVWVINHLAQTGAASKDSWFSPMDEDAIDLMSLLLRALLERHSLETHLRGVITQLAVPLVKVAILDRRVFVQTMHPARGLLNLLIEACEIDAHENSSKGDLTIQCEAIVEKLLIQFKQDPVIFAVLEDELRGSLIKHRHHIDMAERRTVELQRGQERLEAARAVVAAQLGQRLDGRMVPQAIEDFLRQPWAHHLTMALMREGDGGPMVMNALAVADGVLHELTQAQRQIVNVPWLQEWRHGLVKVFSSVGMGGRRRQPRLTLCALRSKRWRPRDRSLNAPCLTCYPLLSLHRGLR